MAALNYSTNGTDLSPPLEIISDTDQGGLVVILAAFSLSLVLAISLPIRTYARNTLSAYKVDDYAFLGAVLFCMAQSAVVFYTVHIGFGRTRDLIDSSFIEPMEKSIYSSDILYIIALALSKLSTAFLFLRLTPGRGHVMAIWCTICLSIAWTIVSIFLLAFRCHASHPWTDTIYESECPTMFVRWQVIGALDIITEVALFSISLYLVWSIQMSRSAKALVIGAFGCRIPIIALVGIRLYYIKRGLDSDDPTYVGAAAASLTQIEIGYSIMASIVPCLKTFMAPYERPDPSATHYHNSGNGTNYKLSSLASQSEHDNAASNASVDHTSGVVQQQQYTATSGKKFLGKLRPEQTVYEARVTHNRSGDGKRASLESGNSQRMIIKKGVEWSVDYDTQSVPHAISKDEESPYTSVVHEVKE